MTTHSTIVKVLLQEPAPLSGLQAAAQVSLPTLRKAVQELLDARWIRVVGQAEANGGRPATLYGIDEDHFLIVGLHLQLPSIRLILTTLSGKVLEETVLFEGVIPAQSQSINAVADYLVSVRSRYNRRPILGIGIASPGFIDPHTGDIITIGRVPAWSNFPYCRRLQTAVGLPVHIANDIDCMAYAELEMHEKALPRNLAYIGFDEGVKASLFLNGEIYRGTLGNAGLISSRLLHVDGMSPSEEPGKLLSIAGISAVFEQRVHDLPPAARTPYAAVLEQTNARSRFQRILSNAHADMPLCHDLMLEMIRVLSAATANLIYIIQPGNVVIGGLLRSLPKALYDQLETTIRQQLPALISHNLIIQQGTITSQNSAAAGAIQHVLRSYLADPASDLLHQN